MNISEIFGYGVGDTSLEASGARIAKHCRFRDGPCTKSSKTDPLGICSLSSDNEAASLCPVRFLEGGMILRDAARLAFGAGVSFAAFPEIRILQIDDPAKPGKLKKIGKVDFVLGAVSDGKIFDFAALEVQAAYFSGLETRTALRQFIAHGHFGDLDVFRRPDFRSSAQKRLIPQLQLKVPVFRRWGKKFFVVTDSQFYRSLPAFRSTTSANSELTWLVYPIRKNGENFAMSEVQPVFSEWADVETSLREGRAPDPAEIISELQFKLTAKGKKAPIIFEC